MPRTVYRTATTLNGFIADSEDSVAWLFAAGSGTDDGFGAFLGAVGALVLGSTTYEWVLRETGAHDDPAPWLASYGTRPTFVLTTRVLPSPDGADVRLRSGPVSDHLAEIRTAAGTGVVWIVGGGDVAGQFLDIGVLDEIVLTVAPVLLDAGAPLLPRRLESDRLELRDVHRREQLLDLVYAVTAT